MGFQSSFDCTFCRGAFGGVGTVTKFVEESFTEAEGVNIRGSAPEEIVGTNLFPKITTV